MVVSQESIDRAKPHFIKAVTTNNENVLAGLIRNRFPVNVKVDGLPSLHLAARESNINVFAALADNGASFEEVTMDGRNCVHELCRHGRADLLATVV